MLPDPPSPHFDDYNPVLRGNTFRTPSFLDSTFSYSGSYSDPTVTNVYHTEELPVVGLASINEDREDEGVGQVDVANIIAKLERGKGRQAAPTTAC